MKLSDLTSRAGEWLRGSGPMSEIVISSRIRLARNVAGYPFLTKCTRHQRQALEQKVRETVLAARISNERIGDGRYRPLTNVVNRPTMNGGKGYQLTGHMEIMVPLLFAAVLEEL